MKTEVFLSFRYLFRGKVRHVSFISIIACCGIMLGIATLITVISVMNGFDQELTEKLLRFNYHITVESFAKETPQSTVSFIRGIEGVRSVSPFLQTQVFVKIQNLIVPLVVRGIDFENPSQKEDFSRYIVEESQNEGFYIGEGFRDKFFPDEMLSYYPLKKRLKEQEAPVRGVFSVGLHDIDTNYLICDIQSAKELGENYLLYLGIKIEEPFRAAAIARKLEHLEKEGFMVTTWIEANQVLFAALKLEKFTMFIILSLITLVASFNVFATLTVKVVEKTKDIGVLKSLGFSSRKILSIFSVQGILMGIIGVMLGTALGLMLCFLLREYQFIKLPAEIYYIKHLPVSFNLKDIALIAVIGVALSFLSSLWPALRASGLNPSDALRYE